MNNTKCFLCGNQIIDMSHAKKDTYRNIIGETLERYSCQVCISLNEIFMTYDYNKYFVCDGNLYKFVEKSERQEGLQYEVKIDDRVYFANSLIKIPLPKALKPLFDWTEFRNITLKIR